MTTIAYRNGIMAADTRAYAGERHPIGSKIKVYRLTDGSLFAASSARVGQVEKLRRLVEQHGVDVTIDDNGHTIDVQAIVVRTDGQIFYFSNQDSFSGPIEASFIAIGSGQKYAHGAMMMGADAVTAVKVACECDPWSAGPVAVMHLKTGETRPIITNNRFDTNGRIGASSCRAQVSPRKTRTPAE